MCVYGGRGYILNARTYMMYKVTFGIRNRQYYEVAWVYDHQI